MFGTVYPRMKIIPRIQKAIMLMTIGIQVLSFYFVVCLSTKYKISSKNPKKCRLDVALHSLSVCFHIVPEERRVFTTLHYVSALSSFVPQTGQKRMSNSLNVNFVT